MRRAAALVFAGSAIASSAGSALAGNTVYAWNGGATTIAPGSSNWSTGANWTPSLTGSGNATTALLFTNGSTSGNGGWTSTDDIAAFSLNSLTITNNDTSDTDAITLSGTNAVNFSGSGGQNISATGAGNATINGPGSLTFPTPGGLGTTTANISNTGAGVLTISAVISSLDGGATTTNNSGLIIGGTSTTVLGGTNTFVTSQPTSSSGSNTNLYGGITVLGGATLSISSANNLGTIGGSNYAGVLTKDGAALSLSAENGSVPALAVTSSLSLGSTFGVELSCTGTGVNSFNFAVSNGQTLTLNGLAYGVNGNGGGTYNIRSGTAGGTVVFNGGLSTGQDNNGSARNLSFDGPGNITVSSPIGIVETVSGSGNVMASNLGRSVAVSSNGSTPLLYQTAAAANIDFNLTTASTFSGTLTLSANNYYGGASTLNSGTVLIGGSVSSVSSTTSDTSPTSSGSNTVTVGNSVATGLFIGEGIFSGTNIPYGDTITGINTSTNVLTLASATVGAISANASLYFSDPLGANIGTAVTIGATSGSSNVAFLMGGAYSMARAITLQSGSSGTASIGQGGSGIANFIGAITLNKPVYLIADTGATAAFSNSWTTGNNAVNIGTSGNTGTIQAASSLVTTGGINVNYGTLYLEVANDIGSSTTPVTVGGGTLNVNSLNDAVQSLTLTSGNISGTSGVITASSAYAVQSGSVGAILGGSVALNKTTTGVVTLSGVNSYSGATSVTAGTLCVNGSTASGSAVTVGDGANANSGTLSGSGSVHGTVLVQEGGTIAAGPSAGVIGGLTTGAETWNSGGAYVAKVSTGSGATNDLLTMSGLTVAATSGSPFNIDLISQGTTVLAGGQQLVLATVTGASQGQFNTSDLSLNLTNVSAAAGYTIEFVDSESGSNDELIAEAETSPAPEPTSALLFGFVTSPILLARRRKRNQSAEIVVRMMSCNSD